MSVLGKYGITDQQLNAVANYYRFTTGQTWPHRAARFAVVTENGRITGLKIVDAGVGYPYLPTVRIIGHPELEVTVTLRFTKVRSRNGSIATVKVARAT